MKSVMDIFDVVLLIIVTAIMLPCIVFSMNIMREDGSFGFFPGDDKTMKQVQNEYVNISEIHTYSAADVLLEICVTPAESLTERFAIDGTVYEKTPFQSEREIYSHIADKIHAGFTYEKRFSDIFDCWEYVKL